jgi:hypothetical protein
LVDQFHEKGIELFALTPEINFRPLQVEYGIESDFVSSLPPSTSVVRKARSEDLPTVRKYL